MKLHGSVRFQYEQHNVGPGTAATRVISLYTCIWIYCRGRSKSSQSARRRRTKV